MTNAPTDLREQIFEAVSAWLNEPDGGQTMDELAAEGTDAVMAVIEDEAIDRMAEQFIEETRIRSMDFRNGFTMDVEPSRALVAQWVGAARGMLGDAENYSETPIEMEVKVAESPERYAFILQRVGKLTPHQARKAAEAEAERLRALAAEILARFTRRANIGEPCFSAGWVPTHVVNDWRAALAQPGDLP